MTELEASDVARPAKQEATTASWLRASVTYLVLVLVVGAGAIFGIMGALALAFVLIIGAVPYTLIATFFIVRKRSAARRALDGRPDLSVETPLANFGGMSQKLSLVNGIMLGLLGILLLLSMGDAVPLPDNTGFILAPIAAFSAVEIVVNAGWIYRKETVLAEEYAIRTRTHSWKLIIVNRWLGWVIWYTGAGIAGFMLLTQSSSFFS